MANQEHVRILKQGVEAWNKWRKANPKIGPDLSEAYLSGVYLSGAYLSGADLSGVYLSQADLSGADLSAVYLNDADLSGAYLISADLLSSNLSQANLSGAEVRRANLSNAYLSQADLSAADLSGADLSAADLSRADLSDANLSQANLYRANLTEANLYRANLTEANLNYADLSQANFSVARIGWTHFDDVNLSVVKGLDTVAHNGPSYIDIQTIYESQGNIPEAFLHGAGVPDTFITFMKSLTGAAIDFYSCFISYSTKDQAFTERLYADLQAKGVRCWYAPHDIQAGKKIHEQIDQAIRIYEKVILVLSKHSMRSKWVNTEIYKTRKREDKEKRQMLFPISLVPHKAIQEWEAFNVDSGLDMAREVREYYIPDFTDWKNHDAYQKAFECLMRDLKTEG